MRARFTNICPPVLCHWANKVTATIYDRKTNKKIATVPAYTYRTRKEAIALAKHICDILNAAETVRVNCHFTRERIIEAFKNGPDISAPVFGSGPHVYGCNGGDCQRHKLGAEPCTDCPYCDERGNI